MLLPVTGPAAQTSSVSEWKPGCYIDGQPLDLTYFFCNTGYFNGRFDGAKNHYFFGGPGGAYLNIAIYDSSERGFRLWGPRGDTYSQFEEMGPSQLRGTGVPEDPFEHRGVFGAGDPRQLVVTAYTEYVNGRSTFETRWEIENVGTAPVNFRTTVFADVAIHGQCAYGELRSNPRELGSFTPREGVPYEPNDCTATERDRGFSGYAIERAGSPWSAYQQGDEYEIYPLLGDASGPGLNNTYQSQPGPEALAIQWDQYGTGQSPLEPGQTASFRLGWRFSSDLLATPFHGDSPDSVHRVTLTTRYARNGPLAGQRVAYEIARNLGNVGTTRGTVVTNDRGVAHVSWRQKNIGYDQLTVSFDDNRDGRIQESTELHRFGMSVRWGRTAEHYRTGLSFGRIPGGFGGRIRAIHEEDPDFGADCRKYRTIAIRRRAEGRDPTLGSAASGLRGVWDLQVAAGSGGYYAVALPEWRVTGAGVGYRCKGARAG